MIVAVLAAGVWLMRELPAVSDRIDELHRAEPGRSVRFTVAEAVDWDVFLEPSTARLSGFRFALVDADGTPVRLGDDHGFTYNWFGRSGRSIASADLAPGVYEMWVVEGTAGVAIGSSPGDAVARAILGAALIGGIIGVPALVLTVVSAVRDTRRRNATGEPPPPSPWSSGEWPADPAR
jgi:hypothetical protein